MINSSSDSKIFGISSIQKVYPRYAPIEGVKNLSLHKLLTQAFQLQSKEYFDKAIALYEKLVLSYPKNVISKVNLAVCLIKLNMNERALQVLTQAECLSPTNFFIIYNKALTLYYLNQKTNAINIIDEALKLSNSKELLELKEFLSQCQGIKRCNSKFTIRKPYKLPKTAKKLENTSKAPKRLSNNLLEVNSLPIIDIKIDSSQLTSLSSTSKPLTYDELLLKKDYVGQLLLERNLRLSLIYNSPMYREKSALPNGFVQENLLEEPQIKRNKIIITNELSKENEIITQDTSIDEITNKKLSRQSVKFILEEYKKPIDERNYPELIRKFSKLPFFHKFPRIIQKMLLEIAVLLTYNTEDIIIKQGDLGECMFVILSGSVNVTRQAAEFRNFNIVVNSLYDGEAFGELALLSNPKEDDIRRTASCIAGETTTLISISKSDYRHILIDKMHNDIISRIQFFMGLSFFQDQQ